MNCVNIAHPEFKNLLNKVDVSAPFLAARIGVWMDKNTNERFPTLEELNTIQESIEKGPQINQVLKIIDVLSNKIQRKIFTKDKLQGWLNDLQKQGVSGQQLELFEQEAKPGMTKDEIATAIAANYSYAVEINTAKNKIGSDIYGRGYKPKQITDKDFAQSLGAEVGDYFIEYITEDGDPDLRTFKTLEEANNAFQTQRSVDNSSVYSNLTVPGGINYTENEIATPAITPSIKGHAQFSTKEGIGWFRSDESTSLPKEFGLNLDNYKVFQDKNSGRWDLAQNLNDLYLDNGDFAGVLEDTFSTKEEAESFLKFYKEKQIAHVTKTRRVLEVQSDLFQKGRDKSLLIGTKVFKNTPNPFTYNGDVYEDLNPLGTGKHVKNGLPITLREFAKARTAFSEKISPENNFLQLLNKNNNWVKFFIKSIIQDSAKKGYEKVLFPTGDTASKVEGHITLEEFKKQKEDRIKELEERNEFNKPVTNTDQIPRMSFNFITQGNRKVQVNYRKNDKGNYQFVATYLDTNETRPINAKNVLLDAYNRYLSQQTEKNNNEINQLKQELERIEKEGFGALKPIYNFYENTVGNILKKQYGKENIKQITDKHGNTWNEVTIKEKRDKSTIFLQVDPIRHLGIRYNMNTAGFMPYNVNLYQVKQEAAKLGLTVAKATSGSYYLKNARGRKINPFSKDYHQLESESEFLPEKELTNKLLEWAKLHGIEVVAMQELINRFATEGNFYDGAVGAASLLNNLIGIEGSKEKIDTLAEEISHFATAILKNDPSVKKAMENIVDTEIYKEVKEKYKDIYFHENDFKKEAVDQLLAQSIVQNFQETETTKGILPYLKAIFSKFWKKIKAIFSRPNALEQIKTDLYPLAQSILNNEYIGKLNTKDLQNKLEKPQIFYQIPEKKPEEKSEEAVVEEESINKAKVEFLKKSIAQLEERLELLKKKQVLEDTEEAKKDIKEKTDRLSNQITAIKRQLISKKLDAGIKNVVDLAENDLLRIKQVLIKYKTTGNLFGNTFNAIDEFIEMYEGLFNGLLNMINRNNYPQHLVEELTEQIKKAQGELIDVKGMNNGLMWNNAAKTIDKNNIDAAGNKIDPDLDGKKILEEVGTDIGYWRLLVGNLKFSKSKILNTALKIISDSVQNVKRFTVTTGNDLLAAQQLMEKNSKYKVEDFIAKNINGERTQYLIRGEDWAPYFAARKKAGEELAVKFGKENFNEVHYETLTPEERVIYSKTFGKIKKEYLTTIVDEEGNFAGVKPKAKTAEFANMMKNKDAKLYYDMLLAKRREAINKLPKQYRTEHAYYRIPGIRQQFLERMFTSENLSTSFLTNIKELAKETLTMDQDDTQFGEMSELGNKMVPIFFTREFSNPKNVSSDLTRSFTLFSEMAENFREMNKIAGNMETIRKTLAGKDIIINRQKKEGVESKEYKALDILMDSHIYGISKKDNPIKIGKFHISPSKLVGAFTRFIRTNNLALNVTTSTAGYLKGSIDSILEDQIGLYTTVESKNWARLEYGKNLTQVILQVGQRKQTNKMHLLLQLNNVIEISRMLKNSNKNKFARKIINRDLLFTNYQTADYPLKGRATLAILDNFRLYNDNFINRKDFLELKEKEGITKKKAKKEWSTLREKSLYNAYEVVNTQLQVKDEFKEHVTDAVLNRAMGTISHVTHLIDGTMGLLDKGSISRGVFGDFLLMHRGWFINTIDNRTMPPSFNMLTGQEEMGSYRATISFIRRDLIGKAAILHPSQYRKTWDDLSAVKKRGIKKTVLDFIYLNIMAIFVGIANLAADDADDEDWTTQYFAYQMNRVLLEQGAAWKLGELLQMIDEPVVGVRTIKDIVDFTELWNAERYERGMYEDWTHAGKWWLRKTPVKNIYELQFPEEKNKFIKQVVDSPIYNWMVENEDELEGLTITQRLKSFIGMNPNYDEKNIYYDIEALEDYFGEE